ncbi:MAG TPA: class I SAM-dependent methyltransferase [Ramlibacter sp.]|uniref:class I SAM-dependent methyltransferase n=1 Tax=Ramlibacter sp. TaxID=1917967 RepID=UPI002C7858CF|nr:class I SAM-dependent methyltransferase [Ramlibacter sp.]HVZ44073.1 class I SAM-dependent methyltransferase [Ramlibacter sp.]
MAANQIIFEDGAGYERMMGVWSRLAGERFLDWLAPERGWRWVDVGCGNGAFTELLVERCAPTEVQGVDPSEAQLAYARGRTAGRVAKFLQGGAEALPFAGEHFDAAVMALVIFFVADPAAGVSEMVRVVRPGGSVSAYAWDITEGGFPLASLQQAMKAMDIEPAKPPSADAARLDNLRQLWTDAGLRDVETTQITVQREFAGFDEFWDIAMLSASTRSRLAGLAPAVLEALRERLRDQLSPGAVGPLTMSARANAVKGQVPH